MACKREVGNCDLILTKFFHIDNTKNHGPNNALYKISAKYI